jgi:hypothetical protein
LIAASVAVFAFCCKNAPPSSSTPITLQIEGKITDDFTGQPLFGARVSVINYNWDVNLLRTTIILTSVYTDQEGSYSLKYYDAEGCYSIYTYRYIQATADGYESKETVDGLNCTTNVQTVNLQLRRI